MISIRIEEDAFSDLEDGYWFYENMEAGVGDYFASTLRSEIDELHITGGIHRRIFRDYHRVLSRVFPYAIYYTMTRDEVVIWGVVDCRRDPEWIRKHLER